MNAPAPHRLLALVALGFAATVAAADPAAPAEVLDLDEAAALLRVTPALLAEEARAQRVPARAIGALWRFSRTALLQWLAAGPAAAERTPLREAELSTLRGRGVEPAAPARVAQAAPDPSPAATPAPPPTVGEAPSAPTAEEVALREQRVVLERGALSLDVGLSYAYSEQSFFPFARQERRSAGLSTALRYGLANDLQATLRLPAASSRIKTYALGSGGGPATESSTGDSSFGDAALSLRGVALREGSGRPNLMWSLDAVLPSGPGDRGLGGGLVLSKSYDPAVVFAGLSVLRGLALDPTDARRSLPRRSISLSTGYTYAVNDALALSTVFSGLLRSTTTPDDGSLPPSRERYQLQLGLTWLLARGLFLEPGVALRLGGQSPDLTGSLNIAYTLR